MQTVSSSWSKIFLYLAGKNTIDKCIQTEVDYATSFRENVWSYPYFLYLEFSTLSGDGGLNSLRCQTLTDINRKFLVSKHSWADQPAASPWASSQTEVAILCAAARQATESGVSSPAYYVLVPPAVEAKALLQQW